MDILSRRIRDLRVDSDMKQGEMAAALGITQNMVSNYENGREPPLQTILLYAKYFDVSIDYLLGLSNERKNIKGDLQEMLDRLSGITDEPFLTAADIASLINAIAVYEKEGHSIGSMPISATKNFILSMTKVINAITTRNVPELIDQTDAAMIALLDVAKIVPLYFQYMNLFEPKEGTES